MNRFSPTVIIGAAVIAILLVLIAIQFLGGSAPDPTAGDASERIAAVSQIASEASADAGEEIARVGVKDPDPRVRCAAMVFLRKFARPEIRTSIEQGTRDDAPRVRAAAAVTLGKYADEKAESRLGELLKADKDDEVRLAAALALARCKTLKSTKMLVSAMKSNSSREVKKQSLLLLLRGTGVSLTPEPDPRNAKLWARHMKKVMRYVDTTWSGQEPGGRNGQ